ncbi:hypothetical protein NEMBOFW57_009664 [Staphylotrichum longicolle]|uniref:Mannose-6-phosphate isomerase n=1 Tax=Staphylotrichum longicolle TaxID=669026 RepID=A0AAD4EPH7_9PEZI|nr:hypothetical protein NEMBOFW57_009664 [Staphylotrichum longicolle]
MTDRVFQLGSSRSQHNSAEDVKDFEIKDDEFYSEMWFGDYPDFPARVLKTGELLKDALDKNKETLLGKKVITQLDGQLPFLPKILSIAKALPLQIHPNKDLAAKLHAKDPDNFTDPNHKPEIAVALSKFEVFAGFKPLSEISPLFQLPALRPFVPPNTTQWTDQTLREVTRALLKADDATVKRVSESLLSTSKSDLGNAAYILDLLPRLQKQYGSEDPGSLVALTCMNFMVLGPGDALYIPADGIHAYLSGDIVECMARSNNVLNSGFCPPADRNNIDLFTDTLTFEAHSKGDMVLKSEKADRSKTGKTRVYRPPMSEFDMLRAELEAGEEDEIEAGDGPGVLIVTRGSGKMEADGKDFELSEGAIYFVAPGVKVNIITTPDAASTSLNPPSSPSTGPSRPHKLLTPRPYAVRAIPGKGYGAVATRRIKKGKVILVDPASVLAMVEYPADVSREEVRGLLREGRRRLGDPTRVEGLAKRGGRETEGMEEVMLTNSFGVEVGGGEYMALLRIWRPNAFIHFSQTTLAMSVWSARDIEPGEEITITSSTCSLCTGSHDQLNASDANHEEIRSLQDKVVELAQAGKYHKAVKAAERMFSLIEEEGMTEHMGGMYEIPARLYYHIGNYDKALEYTLKVRDEIDGFGLPGKLGEEKMKMLDGVVEQIRQKMGGGKAMN